MDTQSKIAQLEADLRSGQVMTPLTAWSRYHMAHNTYHRSIHSLKHRKGLPIKSRLIDEGGVRHSEHWISQLPL